ncbi:hypothetical protein [Pseudacidovorax intermedius]|uniref:DUF7940 domain-containing protein n=1 Tax=Pseudacidovorax intermedius TaxID=433924 RepID=UPI0026E9F59B|nr:hypothetical protein [Pseudacidovorax intermedius]
MRLIDDWRQFWRFASVRAAALLAVLSLLQTDLLPHVQALVPPRAWPWVSLGFAALIVVVRVIAQPALREPAEGGK